MIQKVLIAEDHESANLSVQRTLEELNITEKEYVYYCDDALQRVAKSKKDGQSYDLLITDLYFEADSNVQKIEGGAALIAAVREVQPDLKILVFSAEDKANVIEGLFNNLYIDGYVRKARNDAKDLKLAIEAIAKNQTYFPRHLRQRMVQNPYDFSITEKAIIQALAEGKRQKDIPLFLQEKQLHPSSLSSIEKSLSRMKEALNCLNNEQLIVCCKDMGIV